MGNELNLYDFNGNSIRVIEIDGVAWFPAKDVCDTLGLVNSATAVSNACDAEDFRVIKASEVSKCQNLATSFPNRGMTCVNETGIYDLVATSQKPAARAFRKWVHGTVLPAIRKDGGYIMGEEKVATGEMDPDELMARAVILAQTKIDNLKTQLKTVTTGMAGIATS